jgi:hypothetical protein
MILAELVLPSINAAHLAPSPEAGMLPPEAVQVTLDTTTFAPIVESSSLYREIRIGGQ